MEFALPAVLLLIMAIGFWICGVAIKASQRRLEKECINTKGTVVEYRHFSHWSIPNSPYYPVISVVINGEVIRSADTTCISMWPESHPVGTKIHVLYRKVKLPIIGCMDEIRVNEEGLKPVSSYAVAVIFKTIALAILAIAIIIVVFGLKN